jgi:hypothetical protein
MPSNINSRRQNNTTHDILTHFNLLSSNEKAIFLHHVALADMAGDLDHLEEDKRRQLKALLKRLGNA